MSDTGAHAQYRACTCAGVFVMPCLVSLHSTLQSKDSTVLICILVSLQFSPSSFPHWLLQLLWYSSTHLWDCSASQEAVLCYICHSATLPHSTMTSAQLAASSSCVRTPHLQQMQTRGAVQWGEGLRLGWASPLPSCAWSSTSGLLVS